LTVALAVRTGVPHPVWAADPQAAWTAAELLGWTEPAKEVVGDDPVWEFAIRADQARHSGTVDGGQGAGQGVAGAGEAGDRDPVG
jgi:hypothetical protein